MPYSAPELIPSERLYLQQVREQTLRLMAFSKPPRLSLIGYWVNYINCHGLLIALKSGACPGILEQVFLLMFHTAGDRKRKKGRQNYKKGVKLVMKNKILATDEQ